MARRTSPFQWLLTILAVVAVCGLLVALLLPSVQSAREAARRHRGFDLGPPAGIEGLVPGEGQGPGMGGDKFDRIYENPFKAVVDHPLSTFSIDVDTASYSKVRQYILDYGE